MSAADDLLELVLANDAGFGLYKRQHWRAVFRDTIGPWLAAHDAEVRAGVVAEEPGWEGVTGRGFGFTEILVADYEGQPPRPFTVQQSSLATECKVWIGSGDTRAHMNIEEASRVRDALNAFLAAAGVPVEPEGGES